MKAFQTDGPCLTQDHYMVDLSARADKAIEGIDRGDYFILSRPPQSGKTTFLSALKRQLSSRYYVLDITFQDVAQEVLGSEHDFVHSFTHSVSDAMNQAGCSQELIALWNNPDTIRRSWHRRPIGYLRRKIRELCRAADRPIVLLADDVDCAAEHGVFRDFLGALRENFLSANSGMEACFQSVILAGVEDVRIPRASLNPPGHAERYGPWNIADDLDVDLNLSAEEIAGMLRAYESDHHTGMNIPAVSGELRRLTSGHPYVVSWLCDWLDRAGPGNWSAAGVGEAGNAFLVSDCVLLQRMRKTVNDSPGLKDALTGILLDSSQFTYQPPLPRIERGILSGILAKGCLNHAEIASPLFRDWLSRYCVSAE